LTVVGDTGGSSNLLVNVNAYSQVLGLNANTQVTLTTSTTQTSSTYTISGLADGSYQVFAFLPGYEITPAGSKGVTVSGVANLDLTLKQVSGKLAVTVSLPNGGDYTQVHLSLQGSQNVEVDMPSGPAYTFKKLPSGFYTLTATYLISGAQSQQFLSVVNGQTASASVDLTPTTYAISGIVSIQTGFTMRSSTGSVVSINTIDQLVTNATNQTLIIGGQGNTGVCVGGTVVTTTTARVEAFPRQFGGSNTNPNTPANCYGVGAYKYGVLDSSGNYTIPNLTPGVWQVDVYPNFDGGTSPNVAISKQTITITGSNQTGVNFTLASGFSVSGTISFPAGVSDTRAFNVQILDTHGTQLQSGSLQIGSGVTPATSASYIFSNLPSGTYALVLREQYYFDPVLGQITKYVAKPVSFTIAGGDQSSINLTLAKASRMVGRLAILGKNPDQTSALTLITGSNETLLPSNFGISAQAFPWVEGGFSQASTDSSGAISLDSNNQFRVEGLVAGAYDVQFNQNSFSASQQAQGSINLANLTKAQIQVSEGQTLDLGTITLTPGLSLSGTVSDMQGHRLPNIVIRANASANSNHGSNSIQATTDSNGQYTLLGLDSALKTYDLTVAPRPQGSDNTPAVPYGQVTKRAVDVTQTAAPSIDFTLSAANSVLTGTVVTGDGGALSYPEDKNSGFPVAAVYLRAQGSQLGQDDNPLGNITEATGLDGRFTVSHLVAGTYVVTIESLGYRPIQRVVTIDGTADFGTATLQRGDQHLRR
jgi:hypothetical protein